MKMQETVKSKKAIRSERPNLFEPNDYISMVVTLSGELTKENLEEAVKMAYANNESTMSKIVLEPDGTAYLSRFGVSPEFQNHGVGKSLMSVVDTVMMEKGVKRLELHTAAKYFDLVRFYYGRKFYIDSISEERGYKRALMVKEYQKVK